MASGFTITISAVDKATRVMNNITKRITAMNAPVRRFRGAFGRFMDATGVRRVAGAFRDWTAAGISTAASLVKIIEPMGILTGAASIAGLYRLTTAWAQFGQRLGFDAQRIGIMPDKLQALQGAAEEAGSSAGSLTSGMRALRDNMVNAIGGRNNEALLYFRQFQHEIPNLKSKLKDVGAFFPELADQISKIKDPTLQARVATAWFGGAAEDLLPFLRMGSKGIHQYVEDVKRFGLTNQAGIKAAGELSLAQHRLGLATRGLAYSIAEQAAPGLKSLLDWFTNLIAKNREAIAARIGQAVQTFAKWLKSVDWQKIGDEIGEISDRAQGVIESLGGWKETAKDVGKVIMAVLVGKMLLGFGMLIARSAQVVLAIKAMQTAATASQAATAALTVATAGGAAATGGAATAATGAAAAAGGLSRIGRYGRAALRIGGSAMRTLGWVGAAYDVGNLLWNGASPSLSANDTVVRRAPLPRDIAAAAHAAADRYGIDQERFASLLQTEGGGYKNVSPAGAFGPAQLMPRTAAGLGLPSGINAPGYSWQGNLDGGARLFRQLLDQFHGNYNAAEAAYNAGPNNAGVQRFAVTGDMSGLPEETRNYVNSISALTASAKRMQADGKSGNSSGQSWNDFSRRMVIDLRVHNDGHPNGSRVSVKGARMAGGGAGPKISTAMPATG